MLRRASTILCFHNRQLRLVRLVSSTTGSESKDAASRGRGRTRSFKKVESNSFLMNLFKGEAHMEQMFPFPEALTTDQIDTLKMILDPVIKFLTEVNSAKQNDLNERISEKTMEGMKELGGFGMQVPPEFGGIGANNSQTARLSQVVGGYDISLGITLGAHQSIGFKGILLFGTEDQKKRYLPDLSSGNKIAAYCLTEPSSGSDAMSIRMRAVLSPDGKNYILNGSKIWISNGGIADIFTVFAQTSIKTESGETKDKITAFIVERAFKGVTSGPPEKKMGIRASNTTTVNFDDVHVPVENVLGEVGQGFKVAMHVLNNGRFGMAGLLCGTMRYCIGRSIEHVTTRSQFGNKLATFGNIQEKIARMAMALYISESMTYMLSGNMDRGFTDYQLEAACTKVVASENAWFTADETIQIHGGMGFMWEAELERILRDLRIFRIFEGANDILRLFVALQGLQFAGGHLKELQRALRNPTAHLGLILDYGSKRMRRAVGLSTVSPLTEYVPSRLATPAALASRSIEMFGASVESLLITYGKNIIDKQFLLIRLANSAIDIYSMIVVLSRATRSIRNGYPSADHEALLVDVICNEASERVQSNLGALHSGEKLSNFDKMQSVTKEMCEAGGVIPNNPLNV